MTSQKVTKKSGDSLYISYTIYWADLAYLQQYIIRGMRVKLNQEKSLLYNRWIQRQTDRTNLIPLQHQLLILNIYIYVYIRVFRVESEKSPTVSCKLVLNVNIPSAI